MKTQTALYTWTAPDGTPRYLIDPAEWQEGQQWTRSNPSETYLLVAPRPLDGPVWVRELLPVTVPLPEVHWIDGHPVAMFDALPHASTYTIRYGGSPRRKVSDNFGFGSIQPVIVVSWPDGSKPVPPTVDGAR